jgi:hypothetical protein
LFPGPALTGAPDVAFTVLSIPLWLGIIAGRIVFTSVQEIGVSAAVLMWSEVCAIFFVNWIVYFLLFSYFIPSRNQKKQRLRMERIAL